MLKKISCSWPPQADMPRVSHPLGPGFPNQITRRSTNRQTVFCTRQDRRVHLELLREIAAWQRPISRLLLDAQPHTSGRRPRATGLFGHLPAPHPWPPCAIPESPASPPRASQKAHPATPVKSFARRLARASPAIQIYFSFIIKIIEIQTESPQHPHDIKR